MAEEYDPLEKGNADNAYDPLFSERINRMSGVKKGAVGAGGGVIACLIIVRLLSLGFSSSSSSKREEPWRDQERDSINRQLENLKREQAKQPLDVEALMRPRPVRPELSERILKSVIEQDEKLLASLPADAVERRRETEERLRLWRQQLEKLQAKKQPEGELPPDIAGPPAPPRR